jgi:pimeloyl-ACP methyl ester carboxylesterase
MSKRIIFGRNSIAYQVFGKGKKILLAFHGFGQSSDYYRDFEKELGNVYTIYSYDLLIQGKTKWAERSRPFEKEDFKDIFHQFFEMKTFLKLIDTKRIHTLTTTLLSTFIG